ncbi:MAG: tRNA pseudouridine(38-40) synthase TruA [Pseudomonadota bacterium]
MPRFKLTIEYAGTGFAGWQRQEGQPSVQQAIEEAIERFCGDTLSIQGAGRTDAGVHALAQVAHADLSKDWSADRVRDAVNAHLRPLPIAVLEAERVSDDFQARFSAIRRHYHYRIINRRAPLTLDRDRAWLVPKPLNADAMHQASQRLVGYHDFTTFRSVHCQARSPVKTLDVLEVSRDEDAIDVYCSAPSFLHNQVRSLVGSLKLVGEGRWSSDDLAHALAARDRKECGPVAPACGLTLVAVDYPD